MSARTMLNQREVLALVDIVRAEYVSSGLTNAGFADQVNANPGHAAKFRVKVTEGNVKGVLETLEIENNMARRAREAREAREAQQRAALQQATPTVIQRIEALERQVADLTKLTDGLR